MLGDRCWGTAEGLASAPCRRVTRRAALASVAALGLGALVAPRAAVAAGLARQEPYRVLAFTKTTAYRHDSIPDAVAALRALGAEHGFAVDHTEDAAVFGDAPLASYRAVAFVLTTGEILDDEQQAAFERFIRAGGGYVGVHSACDTEYAWPWYGRLVGAYFKHHPEIQAATVLVEDRTHPSTAGLPERWERTDEWYDFQIESARSGDGAGSPGRVNVQRRRDGRGSPDRLVPRVRGWTGLVHGGWAHGRELPRAAVSPAPAGRHPVRRWRG